MALYAIGDLHLCLGADKPMDIFGGAWIGYMEKLKDLIGFSLPHYAEEGKALLVIAIGCTGGHHRSVAVARELISYIRELGYPVAENHRDMTRG